MFTIKNEDNLVKVSVLSRPYKDSDNYWDINWLICGVYIKIPGFIADFSTYIRTDELKSFYDELRKMNSELKGTASLSTMERGVFIKSHIDKFGKIEWSVETQYPEGTGAELTFEFGSDQSYLCEIINDIKSIIEEYPVINI
jgi:hypothetical protein